MPNKDAGRTFKKPKAEFEKLHDEWVKYHEGKVVHPETGEEVSKAELRELEISDIVEQGYKELQAKIGKKGRVLRREEVEPHIYEIAEKAYMAQIGIKDKKAVDQDVLRQNARQYFMTMASRATGQQFNTFEEAMQAVLEATNPIYGKTDAEKSRILESLLRDYATWTHESKYEDTKGQRASRLLYLNQELSHKGHLEHLKGRYGGIFEQYGRKGHKFGPNVEAQHILGVAEEAYVTDKISGNTLRRRHIEGPDVIRYQRPHQRAA